MVSALRHLCEEHALWVLGLVAFASFVGGFMRAVFRDAWALLRPLVVLVRARWLAWWRAPERFTAYSLAVADADDAEGSHDLDLAAWCHDDAATQAEVLAEHDTGGVWRRLAEGHRQSAVRCRQLAGGGEAA